MNRLSDATLNRMTKKRLIEYVRMCEHNYDVAEETLLQQAENVKDWRPVKHGKWITTQKTIDDGITTCSYCNREFYIDDLVQVGNAAGFCEFCPACGSDNRGDADEAKELIENGCYNNCMICGQHISAYQQICHECEVKYNITWGDSITQKVQEYIQNIERGGKE